MARVSKPRTNLVDTMLATIKNNKVLAVLIVLGVVIVALATTAESIERLTDFFARFRGTASEQMRPDLGPQATPQNTGSATTSGPQSPAVTGSGNTFTYGTEPQETERKDDP